MLTKIYKIKLEFNKQARDAFKAAGAAAAIKKAILLNIICQN